MKIFLLGGTDLSLAIVRKLVTDGMSISGVVHLGRSISISYAKGGFDNCRHGDVRQLCNKLGIQNREFESNQQVEEFAREVGGDFLLVAGWYHMVPASLRAIFMKGAAGLHASLLPKLRGGAPLPWSILSGADKTGVSMFALGDEIDAGELYGQKEIPIGPRTNVTDLVAAVEAASLCLVSESLYAVKKGTMKTRPQVGVPSFCLQRTPDDGRIDWRLSASQIDRLVRAVTKPYPGAFAEFDGRRVIIWESELNADLPTVLGAPGQIVRLPGEMDPYVVTGDGCLLIRSAEIGGDDAMPLLRKSANRRFVVS